MNSFSQVTCRLLALASMETLPGEHKYFNEHFERPWKQDRVKHSFD